MGKYLFRHAVNFEGEFLFKTLFKEKKKRPIKYPPMPYAVFTHPEIGGVGPTEEQLKEKKVKGDIVKEIENLKKVNEVIVYLESWGQIDIKKIFLEATIALDKNLTELNKAIK